MEREKLSDREVHRYNRQIILPNFGQESQEKLKTSRVLVVGAGGLGSPALQYLAAAGVGTLGIMDADVVDISNLQRQVLYTGNDQGKPKVWCAKERLQMMNPDITIQAIRERLTKENALEYIPMYDLVLDGSDNFATRYLVNDACVIAGKPFVYGAIYQYEGQVSLFNYKGGPTYRCLFSVPSENPRSASEAGVLGVLPGITGTWQACEAIKALTGVGNTLSGRLFIFNILNQNNFLLDVELNPENLNISQLPED